MLHDIVTTFECTLYPVYSSLFYVDYFLRCPPLKGFAILYVDFAIFSWGSYFTLVLAKFHLSTFALLY
jgi:hypothetical protein